ncbi:unnamed protein product [Gongylonema pulchrum]|uniref:G_PROTEIN_RECEP_F1_2 domain-containing protein n=1 Tax=Gongylonema pulchrum TaxID=637853 RepID=A0A183D5N2_9BILA|nr:unnamed protein product [Gongylonema pulchrum]
MAQTESKEVLENTEVIISILKRKKKTAPQLFRRRLATFLTYVIPVNLLDLIVFADALALLVNWCISAKESWTYAESTSLNIFLYDASVLEDAVRCSVQTVSPLCSKVYLLFFLYHSAVIPNFGAVTSQAPFSSSTMSRKHSRF